MIHARTAAVLACAALLASCGSQPRHVEPRPEPVAPPPAPPSRGITIAAVGDIMMGTDYPRNILPDDDGAGFLAAVTPILSAADVAFGNLEGVLMDGGQAVKRCKPASKRKSGGTTLPPPRPAPALQPGQAARKPQTAPASPSPGELFPQNEGDAPVSPTATDTSPQQDDPGEAPEQPEPAQLAESAGIQPRASTGGASSASVSPAPGPTAPAAPVQQPVTAGSCYVFRSPTRYATYLRDAGFDVLSLANNHAQDFGDPGRDSSMRALDEVGVRHSGREGDVAEWVAGGRRLALVAFAPNVGSHQLNDLAHAQEIVRRLAADHDIVIVSFHGGGEGESASTLPFAHEIYQGEDRGNVVEFAHTVIDAGADLVIGHGPHVLRAIELYRDRLIAYSLGNFATYYGISVKGIRGIAGILTAHLADDGRFLEARLDATIQIRPAGPTLDRKRRAVTQLRLLTTEAFPGEGLAVEDDGHITRMH